MLHDAPLLTLVPSPDATEAICPVSGVAPSFERLVADLDTLGIEQTARRGDRLPQPRVEPGLRVVTRGVLCLTNGETGLCTALIGEGAPAGPSEGVWLTDGAFVDVSFDALQARFGGAAALAIWMRAADLSRGAVEAELVCFVRHAASRRLARWILSLMKDSGTTVMTQTELARLSGLQRTSVCAAMATLQMRGGLKVTRGRIVLQDRAALEREACRCDFHRHLSSECGPPQAGPSSQTDDVSGPRRLAG